MLQYGNDKRNIPVGPCCWQQPYKYELSGINRVEFVCFWDIFWSRAWWFCVLAQSISVLSYQLTMPGNKGIYTIIFFTVCARASRLGYLEHIILRIAGSFSSKIAHFAIHRVERMFWHTKKNSVMAFESWQTNLVWLFFMVILNKWRLVFFFLCVSQGQSCPKIP